MRELEKNITNLFGDRGREWLDSLPYLTEKFVAKWDLKDIQPVDNMSCFLAIYARV